MDCEKETESTESIVKMNEPSAAEEIEKPEKQALPAAEGDEKPLSGRDEIPEFLYLGEAFQTYLIAQTEDRLLLIDKHALHERILFNQMKEKGACISSQRLLAPLTVRLDRREYAAICDQIEALRSIGFGLDDFGDGALLVRECPLMFIDDSIPDVLAELADAILSNKKELTTEHMDWLYHSAACRAAVKAGANLASEEAKRLVSRVLQDDTLRYCPHGRPVLIELTRRELEKQFGFDKPLTQRFFLMMKNYLLFDFGKSFYQDKKVTELIFEKMPVSVSIGLWSTLLIYLISIPLGIKKALKNGSVFVSVTSGLIVVGYAVPSFLIAVFLIILFCGGSYFNLFPLKGLVSDNWAELSFFGKILDYLWHLVLPVFSMTIGGLAGLTMLTKNSFLEEMGKNYVITARAKGLMENGVLYGHVFRNALLIVIAGLPATLVSLLFTGSVLIEVIFSLDGLGLLGYEAVVSRDYPVIFGTLYLFGLLGLALNLISDMMYHLIDPRIDFERRKE